MLNYEESGLLGFVNSSFSRPGYYSDNILLVESDFKLL